MSYLTSKNTIINRREFLKKTAKGSTVLGGLLVAGRFSYQSPRAGSSIIHVHAPTGDGTTDVSNIQAAIDSAIDGDRVILRSGIYSLEKTRTTTEVPIYGPWGVINADPWGYEPIVIDKEISLEGAALDGQGEPTTILSAGSPISGAHIYFHNSKKPTVKDIQFIGSDIFIAFTPHILQNCRFNSYGGYYYFHDNRLVYPNWAQEDYSVINKTLVTDCKWIESSFGAFLGGGTDFLRNEFKDHFHPQLHWALTPTNCWFFNTFLLKNGLDACNNMENELQRDVYVDDVLITAPNNEDDAGVIGTSWYETSHMILKNIRFKDWGNRSFYALGTLLIQPRFTGIDNGDKVTNSAILDCTFDYSGKPPNARFALPSIATMYLGNPAQTGNDLIENITISGNKFIESWRSDPTQNAPDIIIGRPGATSGPSVSSIKLEKNDYRKSQRPRIGIDDNNACAYFSETSYGCFSHDSGGYPVGQGGAVNHVVDLGINNRIIGTRAKYVSGPHGVGQYIDPIDVPAVPHGTPANADPKTIQYVSRKIDS